MQVKSVLALLGSALLVPVVGQADVTANVGWISEYIFRGIPQSDSSASAGLDYEESGFYAGVWGADVSTGAEIDLYAGYGGEYRDVSYGIGVTGYFYTDDFDDTYKELNFNVGYQLVSLDAAFGEYDNFAGPTQDYSFVALGLELGPVDLTFGTFGRDFDGEYAELSFGWEWEGIDLSFGVVHSTDDLLGGPGTQDTSLVFGIGKTFNLAD